MPTAVPPAEPPPPPRPERRVLARAVGVWWVQRLLEGLRRRRPAAQGRDEDALHAPAPAPR